MGDDKSLLTLEALQDILALAIYNIKFSRERQKDKFLTYPDAEFLVGDNLLVRKSHKKYVGFKI